MFDDVSRWIGQIGDTPGSVAQALEFAIMRDEPAFVELALGGVGVALHPGDPGFLTRTPETLLPWRFPRIANYTAVGNFYNAHAAAALALAADGDGPEAQRIRRAIEFSTYGGPCWLHHGLERFEALDTVRIGAPWAPEIAVPEGLFCLPRARYAYFRDLEIPAETLARCHWHMPRVKVLSLHAVGLAEVPEALRACSALENLCLSGNPLWTLPPWLAELPSLRVINARNTRVQTIPGALRAPPGLRVCVGADRP